MKCVYGEGTGEDMESYKPMLTINRRSTVPYLFNILERDIVPYKVFICDFDITAYSSVCNTSNTGSAQEDVRC